MFELTGEYTIILPLMLAIVAATAVSRVLSKDTIYTRKLTSCGVDLDAAHDNTADRMDGLTVASVMELMPEPIPADTPLDAASRAVWLSANGILPVTGPDQRYHGCVTARAVADLTVRPPEVVETSTLLEALDILAGAEGAGVPVLYSRGHAVVGWLTHRAVLAALQNPAPQPPPDPRDRAAAAPPLPSREPGPRLEAVQARQRRHRSAVGGEFGLPVRSHPLLGGMYRSQSPVAVLQGQIRHRAVRVERHPAESGEQWEFALGVESRRHSPVRRPVGRRHHGHGTGLGNPSGAADTGQPRLVLHHGHDRAFGSVTESRGDITLDSGRAPARRGGQPGPVPMLPGDPGCHHQRQRHGITRSRGIQRPGSGRCPLPGGRRRRAGRHRHREHDNRCEAAEYRS
ncbi:hypothetical protein [Nocardia terpenica]|uniref:hypothetical protein n=1 Tax=Nocardia terpenica TaxID=455432 RepID=UPI00359FF1EF